MGGRIPEETIEQILQQIDIVDCIGQYVSLKKNGRYHFGLCPFHSEKSPSFSVTPERQIFYCFGCGKGGTAVNFLMELEQLTFREAVLQLAEGLGIEVPLTHAVDEKKEEEKSQLFQALELAAKMYHHLLTQTQYGHSAREYLLRRRGLSKETILTFQLGIAPPDGQFLLSFLKKRGFSEQLLERAGLVGSKDLSNQRKRYFDRFRGRIILPIHDTQGRVIGFGGRSLQAGQAAKYINSPETILFQKSNYLYNFHRARASIRKQQQAVLFEGYLDVISAWQAGVENAIAVLGTSLTESHVKIIQRNTKQVILCFDSDRAGTQATLRAIDLFHDGACTVKVLQMPSGMDPDDFIRAQGIDAFKEQVSIGAISTTAFRLEQLKREYQLTDDDQRMGFISQAVKLIAQLPRPVERDHYLQKLAKEYHLSLDALRQELRHAKFKQKKNPDRDKENSAWNNGYQEVNKHLVGFARNKSIVEQSEMYLLALMLRDRSVSEWVKEHLGGDFYTEIYIVLAAHLYAYYDQGNPSNIHRILEFVDDPSLVPIISELAMMNIPTEPSTDALKDCVRHIRNYPLQRQIEDKRKLVEQLDNAGEAIKAAELLRTIEELKKKIV
ncbi:DNA primase [Seinonella peptonophila]|uniref:DNA primase n=1 Tax=Seinonella peptonophila TaxID=112248 RepID=A0A1M4V6N7_9BACL|nr:DNA primase [Seinonella peptonophila]SHE64572.1 DNA primase [Seinonella peptonophila]